MGTYGKAAAGAAVLTAALVSAAPAGAHAFLKRSEPPAGAVLPTPPHEVRLIFDEPVRPAPGIDVIRGGAGSVVAAKPYVPKGKPTEIVIPLKSGLAAGPYAVRWSEIDVDDGHLIQGAFIFAIRSGLPPTAATLPSTSGNPPASAVLGRWLLLAGILVAAGTVAFGVLVARSRDEYVLAAALALATLGAVLSVVLQPGESGTRFGRWTLIGAGVAAVGTVAALGSLRWPRLRAVAAVLAVALLGLPTATGHASAAGVSRAVAIPTDLVHLAAAAFWIGGVVSLALVAARGDRETLYVLARRFAPFALAAVALLGVSGVVRAVTELSSVHQLWTTGYGQVLLVKTGLLAAVLVLVWFDNRRVVLELTLLALTIGAVALLTNLKPGRAEAKVVAEPQTVVFAGQDDNLAVGLALTPRSGNRVAMRATVLGFKGPEAGLHVRFAVDAQRAAADACGAGCYSATLPLAGKPHAVSVSIAGRDHPAATLRFAGPAQWPAPSGLDIVRRAERAIDALHTLVVHSRLASDAKHEVTTVYTMVSPNRLSYRNIGGGESVIIGTRRWDRAPGADWVRSRQFPPLSQPAPFWSPTVTNAHVLRTARVDGRPVWVVSFLDPSTPAWFTAWVDRSSYRTLRLEMVATAHFMHDRDGPFNAPVRVEPPKS
jgi:copper transport protein